VLANFGAAFLINSAFAFNYLTYIYASSLFFKTTEQAL